MGLQPTIQTGHIHQGVIRISRNGQVLTLDDSAARLIGADREQLTGQLLSDWLYTNEGPSLLDYLALSRQNDRGPTSLPYLRLRRLQTVGDSFLLLTLWPVNDGLERYLLGYLSAEPQEDDQTVSFLQRQMSVICSLQRDYLADKGTQAVFGLALEQLLLLTRSEYGFIGEILTRHNGHRYLKTHAISNIAWNEETRRFYENNAPQGLEFDNHNTLFGFTLKAGQVVISNEPATDARAAGTPEGHPDLKTYLGMPLYIGEQFVGMAGIANRPNGYNQTLVENLQPLLSTIGNLIVATRNEEQRKRIEQELENKTQQLVKANYAKSHFLACMSHDLRTPLNAILGFSKRLLKNGQDRFNERELDALHAIARNGEQLKAMVADILDLSDIDDGRLQLRYERFDANDLIAAAIMRVSNYARDNHTLIMHRNSMEPCWLTADFHRLKQVLFNLLSNAIKYGQGSDVWIWAEALADNQVALHVRDFGPGMTPEEQMQLFQRFFQLTETSDRPIGGACLGLYLVNEFTQLHKGRVSLNTAPGQGAHFTLLLPNQAGRAITE